MYDAFRKIVDYFYLDDLSVLDSVQDSTEMIELIKLAKLFQLDTLFHAAEHHFQQTLVDWFDNSTVFSLKPLKQSFSKKDPEETPQKQQKEILRARVT